MLPDFFVDYGFGLLHIHRLGMVFRPEKDILLRNIRMKDRLCMG